MLFRSIATRQVKNKRDSDGALTGRAGTVYDVDIKYKTPDGYKHYIKKGFTTKRGDWGFAGIYADKAFTGTKNSRPEFQRLH